MSLESIEKILENPPEELDIPDIGKVLVRLPTIKERLDVKKELSQIPNFDTLSDPEKLWYETCLIAIKCLQKPKISFEQFLNAPDIKIAKILNGVSFWYASKLKELNEINEKGLSFLTDRTRQ